MRHSDVEAAILSKGGNPNCFSVMRSAHDCICLNKRGNDWVVYYSERGRDSEPMFSSRSEEEACDFFINKVGGSGHLHLIAHSDDADEINTIATQLESHGIAPIRNDLPESMQAGECRFRVFVKGTDIFKVRNEPSLKQFNKGEGNAGCTSMAVLAIFPLLFV